MLALLSTVAVVLAAAPAPTSQDLPRLVVLDLTAAGGVSPDVASAFTDAVVTAVGNRGFFRVVSSKEIATLLGMERQKQLLGCGEEATNCMAELTGALDARYILRGAVSKVGDNYQLALQTMDARSATPLGRSLRLGRSIDALRGAVPYVVSEATGTPRPEAPSKVVPISLLVGGGVAIVAGGVVGFNALSREAVLSSELQRGSTTPAVLQNAEYYRSEAAVVGRDKTVALAALGVGAALVATGFLVMPKDASEQLALLPTGNGVALVGVFP